MLSPQYLLWVVGLAAACLAAGQTTQRPVALAVLAAAGLTQLIFPIWWYRLVDGSDAVTGVLVARNVLLVVADTQRVRTRPRRSRCGSGCPR